MAEGVLSVDKPAGLTSHDVVNKVRWLAETRRVGHAGTLDPLATGVLLLCIGRATRLVEYLLGHNKTYHAQIHLGQQTSTYDAEGDIIEEKPVQIDQAELASALDLFRGIIRQQPPPHSAIKIGGEPLYRRARRGEEVEPPLREVHIYELKLISWNSPVVELEVSCSSGTYIRSIAHDLGQELGCGGYLSYLRRLSVGSFSVDTAVPLDYLDRENWLSFLMPSDAAVSHLPRIDVSAEEALDLYHGRPIQAPPDADEGNLVRIYDSASRFVGTAFKKGDTWQARKILLQPVDGET